MSDANVRSGLDLSAPARVYVDVLREAGYDTHITRTRREDGAWNFEATAFSSTFGLAAGPLTGADLLEVIELLYGEAWEWTRACAARGLAVPVVPEVTTPAAVTAAP